MNGAGADEGEQTIIVPVEDGGDFAACVKDCVRCGFCDWSFLLKEYGGKDHFGPLNAEIFGGVEHDFSLLRKFWVYLDSGNNSSRSIQSCLESNSLKSRKVEDG
jgi:hypothetical protein